MNKEIKFEIKKDMLFDFEINRLDGIISIHTYEETFFDIQIDSFWAYVIDNNLNDYCNDYYDASKPDCHGQDTGSLSKEEYFENSYDVLKKDISDYIMKSKFKKYF